MSGGGTTIRYPCGCSYSDQRFIDAVEVCRQHREQAAELSFSRIIDSMRAETWPTLVPTGSLDVTFRQRMVLAMVSESVNFDKSKYSDELEVLIGRGMLNITGGFSKKYVLTNEGSAALKKIAEC